MDLSQVSTDDLLNYKAGAYDKMTTEGLLAVRGLDHASIPQDPGIFDRISADYNKRQANQAAINQAHMTGQQGTFSTGLQTLGQGAGFTGDIGAEIGKSAFSMLPQKDQQELETYLVKAANTRVGQDVRGAAKYIGEKYDETVKDPVTRHNMEAVGNMLGALPVMGAAKVGGQAAIEGVEGVSTSLKGRRLAKQAAEAQMKSQVDRDIGSMGYKLSAEENVQFHPEELKTLDRNLGDLVPQTHAERQIWDGSGAAQRVGMLQKTIAAEPLTLNGALAHRNVLNSQIKMAMKAGNDNEVRLLNGVKDALDKTMMSGDTATWQEANHSWAKAAAKQDLEEMVSRAEGRQIPANSLDTEINKYLNSYQGKLLPPEERKLLEAVVENGTMAKLRKSVAGGLSAKVGAAVGASTGGIPGAVAGHLIGHFGSEFAKDAAMIAKLKKLDRVYEAIDARKMKTISGVKRKPPAPYGEDFSLGEKPEEKPLMITDQREMVGSGKELRYATNEETAANLANRQKEHELGLDPSQRKNISRLKIRKELGPVFDALEEKQKSQIVSQMNKMWSEQKVPITEVIKQARHNMKMLSQEVGTPAETSMSIALKNARRK